MWARSVISRERAPRARGKGLESDRGKQSRSVVQVVARVKSQVKAALVKPGNEGGTGQP